MPYITEVLWQELPHEGQALMVAPWPQEGEERLAHTGREGGGEICRKGGAEGDSTKRTGGRNVTFHARMNRGKEGGREGGRVGP